MDKEENTLGIVCRRNKSARHGVFEISADG
jgi:hypothetical protein